MTDELIELRYGLDSFRSDWRHCSVGSDFLADTAFRTPRSKQLASAAINEVLELAFRLGAKDSKSWVQTTVLPGHTMTLAMDFKIKPPAKNVLRAIFGLLKNAKISSFIFVIFVIGCCFGALENYLFWFVFMIRFIFWVYFLVEGSWKRNSTLQNG